MSWGSFMMPKITLGVWRKRVDSECQNVARLEVLAVAVSDVFAYDAARGGLGGWIVVACRCIRSCCPLRSCIDFGKRGGVRM
jgi:hypothetical protein